jgi:hypothetical protein
VSSARGVDLGFIDKGFIDTGFAVVFVIAGTPAR